MKPKTGENPKPDKFRICKTCDTVYGDWRKRCPNCGSPGWKGKRGDRYHEPGSTS